MKEKRFQSHRRTVAKPAKFWLILALAAGALLLAFATWWIYQTIVDTTTFDGQRAYEHVVVQTSYGARVPGSQAHARTVAYICDTLLGYGWKVELQNLVVSGQALTNVQAKYGAGERIVLLGAHYDSRLQADRDANPQNRLLPVPGANDGASGVAVLLELGRLLPRYFENERMVKDARADEVWLVFFDGEDNGHIPGWDWIMGSRGYVAQMQVKPTWVIIVDMVGDDDLQIYIERHSDPALSQEIWAIAASLGYAKFFIPLAKYPILDDHIPFIEAGIPAVDIIDFDYAYFHTTADTADKVSAQSLRAVGDVLLKWLFPGYNR